MNFFSHVPFIILLEIIYIIFEKYALAVHAYAYALKCNRCFYKHCLQWGFKILFQIIWRILKWNLNCILIILIIYHNNFVI